jgi:NitT/TauT family transport system substrate-binding protein
MLSRVLPLEEVMKNRLLRVVTAAVVALACAGAGAAEEVKVRFSWKLKGEYAHMYVAQEKGYYRNEGINVRLGEGAGSQAALGALIQGQEDAVLLPGIFALTAITKGMPVKLIALYHPWTPMAIISYPDRPIRTPKDLEGKTLPHSVGETATSYLDVLCKLNNVDCSKVNRVQMAPQARAAQFVARKVDGLSVYQTNDLPLIEAQHQDVRFVVLDLPQHGLRVPGMALVSSDKLIAQKPEALRKLLRATAKAVSDAQKDPAEAARLMLKNWSGGPSEAVVTRQVKATVEAIPAEGGRPIGWVDEKVIASALDILKNAKEIDAPRPLDAYFTNALLK